MKSLVFLAFFAVSTHVSLANSDYSDTQLSLSITDATTASETQPFCVPTPSECIYSCPKKTARWELNKLVCYDSLMPILCTCLNLEEPK